MQPAINTRTLILLRLLCVLLLLGLLYRVYTIQHVKATTGILSVKADSPSGALSVTKISGQAVFIGTGSAKARLAPGDYLVASSDNGNFGSKTVHISKGQTTQVTVSAVANQAPITKQVETGYINFDGLLDHGLSATQVINLEQLFLEYKPGAQTFKIDPESVSVIRPDPNSPDFIYTMNFSGTIDGVEFNASTQYKSFEDIQLFVTDPQTGAQLFNDYAPKNIDT